MQAYQRIPDATEGDVALPAGVSPAEYFKEDLVGSLLSADVARTAHLQADGMNYEQDYFTFYIPAAGTQLNVLPDLAVFNGQVQGETSVAAFIHELERIEIRSQKTGQLIVRYELRYGSNFDIVRDDLAVQYAQERGLAVGPMLNFLKYVTTHTAGDLLSSSTYGTPIDGNFEERRYSTGQYVLEVTGTAIAFDYLATASTNQTEAGRYLIAFGNPTGQRNATWGNNWIDGIAFNTSGEPEVPVKPDLPYSIPEELAWRSEEPGLYLSQPREVLPSGEWRIPGLPPEAGEWADHFAGATRESMEDALAEEMVDTTYENFLHRYLSPSLYKTLNDVKSVVGTVKNYFMDVIGNLEKGIDAVGKDEPWSDDEVVERTNTFKFEVQENLSDTLGQDGASTVLQSMRKTRVLINHSDLTVGLGDKEVAPSYTAPAGHRSAVLGAPDGDMLTGVELGDLLIGAQGNDVLYGMAGNDLLIAGGGVDLIDGGSGRDRLILPGAFQSYSIERTGPDAWKLQAPQAAILGSGVERVSFDDLSLALDTDGMAGQVYRLYRAAFDRVPDRAGLGFWINAADHGVPLAAMASQFIASAEFAQRYGQGTTNAEFVARIYGNVLHRQPDVGGFEFWSRMLDQGVSRTDVLATISESPENVAAVAQLIANGIPYLPYH